MALFASIVSSLSVPRVAVGVIFARPSMLKHGARSHHTPVTPTRENHTRKRLAVARGSLIRMVSTLSSTWGASRGSCSSAQRSMVVSSKDDAPRSRAVRRYLSMCTVVIAGERRDRARDRFFLGQRFDKVPRRHESLFHREILLRKALSSRRQAP